ncbi:Uncharacterized protein HZ326_0987 [Fusarium oxysporum f. sp. albedinis]|nr:Uncharacterized protein HZ326_0987 [Fusarium oxysporum f. sp. albedinis]
MGKGISLPIQCQADTFEALQYYLPLRQRVWKILRTKTALRSIGQGLPSSTTLKMSSSSTSDGFADFRLDFSMPIPSVFSRPVPTPH